MSSNALVSYAVDGTDVALWRALVDVPAGHYLDIEPAGPVNDSVTRGFYDLGWGGTVIVRTAEDATTHLAERPLDRVLVRSDGAATAEGDALVLDPSGEVHLVVARGEDAVGRLDPYLQELRPWLVAVRGLDTQAAGAVLDGYQPAASHGTTHVLVRADLVSTLADRLVAPANITDGYRARADVETAAELDRLRAELAGERSRAEEAVRDALRWRSRAVGEWAVKVGTASGADQLELDELRQRMHAVYTELEAVRHTLSWRITKPIRAVRTLTKGR